MTLRKIEAGLQVVWGQYLSELRRRGTPWYAYFELKQTVKNSVAFSRIESGQYEGLQATKESGLIWKFSDDDMRIKPCDCISAPPLPSYVVIVFSGVYHAVRIEDIVKLREEGGISITLEQAEKLAERIVKIG